MSTEEPPTTVAAVPTWLSPFWPANLWIWFVQAEAQFFQWGITGSKTKYEDIVCVLPTEYAMKVHNLLLNPPEDNPYERLKDQLISQIADSQCQKIQQLLTAEVLGDYKPSQLLRKMQQLLGGRTAIDSLLLR